MSRRNVAIVNELVISLDSEYQTLLTTYRCSSNVISPSDGLTNCTNIYCVKDLHIFAFYCI